MYDLYIQALQYISSPVFRKLVCFEVWCRRQSKIEPIIIFFLQCETSCGEKQNSSSRVVGEATEVLESTRPSSANSAMSDLKTTWKKTRSDITSTITTEHSYAMPDFNLEEFIQFKTSPTLESSEEPEMQKHPDHFLSVPDITIPSKSPNSDSGYESWGSPSSAELPEDLSDFNDIWSQSFSDLFPELL